MQRVALFLLVLLSSYGHADEVETKIPLQNGIELRVKEITSARTLPHAYYDQAMSSIPRLYPDAQIIAQRRLGRLDQNPALLYALVAYKKTKTDNRVIVGGVAVRAQQAWSLEATLAEAELADTLLLILEALSNLPFDTQPQSGRLESPMPNYPKPVITLGRRNLA